MKGTLCSVLLCLAALAATATELPQVRIDTGALTGSATGDVETFLGIPYAAAPTGPLRWRAPQQVPAWHGVREAAAYAHDCMQEPYPSDAAPLGAQPAEDCLYLNVWRPAGTKAGDRLPVLIWIYGGGNVNGGASPAVYSGESFARQGVLFVSFNYRVGRFGFFAFPELTREDADHGLLANYGHMDALAALRWVQRNIAAFGGEPGEVTVYGQSAGAGQVYMLLSSPLAEGLFARAIVQSGGMVERPPMHAAHDGSVSIEAAGVNFARRWGIRGTGAGALRQLRALSAQQVTDGLHIGTMAAQSDTFVGPVQDGRIIKESMLKAVEAGREAKVPLLIGSTSADNSRMTARTLDDALATFGAGAELARRAYLTDPSADPQYLIRQMGRDRLYGEPVRYTARTLSARGQSVYEYQFGYVATSMRQEWTEGPPHATDIPFAMNTVRAKYSDQLTAMDATLAQTAHRYWVNFVRTGNPNGPGLADWPRYDPVTDMLMVFGPDGAARAIPDPRRARLDAVAVSAGRAVAEP